MELHLERDEREQGVAGPFARDDFHRFASTFKLLVEALNDIGRPKRYPLLLGTVKERETRLQRMLQTSYRRGKNLVPSPFEGLEQLTRLLFGRDVKHRPHRIGNVLFILLTELLQNGLNGV